MLVTGTHSDAVLRFEAGVPAGLLWNEARWRVLDTPTRIGVSGDALCSAHITHPPKSCVMGWRFIARAESGAAVYVFDIREVGHGRYEVLRVYD